jgi:hypothetical protein
MTHDRALVRLALREAEQWFGYPLARFFSLYS